MTDRSTEDLRKRLGNVDQIRDLLLGSTLAEYDRRLQQYAQKIEQMDVSLSDLKTETRDRLNQLRSDLSNELQIGFDKLNSQVHQLQLSHIEHRNKSQSFEQRVAYDLDSANQSLEDRAQFLKNDLFQTRQQMQEDLAGLSEKLTQSLYSEIARVHHAKLSQADLADILFEICLKLKNSESDRPVVDAAGPGPENTSLENL
jgi:hypothetical protein